MRKNITVKRRMVIELINGLIFLIMILGLLLGWAMVIRAETSLYMDVTVSATGPQLSGRVLFESEDGNLYEFVGVTIPFKQGDKTQLEVVAEFDKMTNSFKVITMYVVEDNERSVSND